MTDKEQELANWLKTAKEMEELLDSGKLDYNKFTNAAIVLAEIENKIDKLQSFMKDEVFK